MSRQTQITVDVMGRGEKRGVKDMDFFFIAANYDEKYEGKKEERVNGSI